MAIVVNDPMPTDPLLLDPWPAISKRSKANAMTDNTQVLDTFPTCQSRTELDRSLHDPDSQIWINL